MKKLTLIVSSLLFLSIAVSHTAYSGINKSNQPNNPNGVEINLHSDVDVYGVQFDLSYNSNHLSLDKEDIATLVDPISVYAKVIEPGMARVIMFSMQGDKIMNSSEDLKSIIDIKFDQVNSFTGETNISLSNLILAGANGTAIELKDNSSDYVHTAGVPMETSLEKNYPNPFNPSTAIPFNLRTQGFVSLKVYDMNGSLVKTLVSDNRKAGSYEVIWNGLNNDGQQVASGQYILQMSAPNYTNTLQMTFLK